MKERRRKYILEPYEVSEYNETTGARAVFPAKTSLELQFWSFFTDAGYWNEVVTQPLSTVTYTRAQPRTHGVTRWSNQEYLLKSKIFDILQN